MQWRIKFVSKWKMSLPPANANFWKKLPSAKRLLLIRPNPWQMQKRKLTAKSLKNCLPNGKNFRPKCKFKQNRI